MFEEEQEAVVENPPPNNQQDTTLQTVVTGLAAIRYLLDTAIQAVAERRI